MHIHYLKNDGAYSGVRIHSCKAQAMTFSKIVLDCPVMKVTSRHLFIQPVCPKLHHLFAGIKICSVVINGACTSAYVRQLHLYGILVPVLLVKHCTELVPESVPACLSFVANTPDHSENGVFAYWLFPVTSSWEAKLILSGNLLQETEKFDNLISHWNVFLPFMTCGSTLISLFSYFPAASFDCWVNSDKPFLSKFYS
jgi:hypothetical protein